jgi:hypothetical protein
MCWKELIRTLRKDGLDVTEAKVRWLITSGKVDRPPLDGSLRFKFNRRHLAQVRAVLQEKMIADDAQPEFLAKCSSPQRVLVAAI